jgi:hypothetical protein
MAEVIKEVTLELMLEHEQKPAIKMRASTDTKAKKSVFEILRDKTATAKSKRLKQQMKRFEKPKYYVCQNSLLVWY